MASAPASPPKHMSSASPPIAKGASARSAVPARVNGTLNGHIRRTSQVRSVTPPSLNGSASINGVETKESLVAVLKRETELKEQLLVQLENKEQTILNITKENDQLSSSLNSAETRLSELYADQNRAEEELAARIEVIEKLRTQARELEKEKRDIQRRYNEQTSTFEAERQSFYDNEQHLKSRIQSLTQTRRETVPHSPSIVPDPEPESEIEEEEQAHEPSKSDYNHADDEPAEMTALKLELSTLSTSYTSLQNTLILLQTQLVDLKRVNNELQEENESYNILLREKTLNGQFDLFKHVGGASSSSNSDQGDDDEHAGGVRYDDTGSLRSSVRSILDPVDETPEVADVDPALSFELEHQSMDSSSSRRRHGQNRKRSGSLPPSPSGSAPKGESLENWGLPGPGLDLAAELGRAENKDILSGHALDEHDLAIVVTKEKRDKKRPPVKNVSLDILKGTDGLDIEALRTEVKALKDANKALSLYASKIIDRIIAQEGFEHVLAIDYEKESSTNGSAASPPRAPPVSSSPQPNSKPRPQSVLVTRSNSLKSPLLSTTERLTTFDSLSPPKTATLASERASRRSMSFDWSNFSLFGEKKPEPTNLRPLTLVAARKLDTEEDDEDLRERERLAATMKLMGIEKPSVPPVPILEKTQSVSSTTPTTPSRFSFFRRPSLRVAASDNSSSFKSPPSSNSSQPNLTQEALEQAEVEHNIATLEAHERTLSAELAKGNGSGFTEIRSGRRRRRSAGGSSGSTVWSAGMSREADED